MKFYLFGENRTLERMVGTPDVRQYEDNSTLIFMSVKGVTAGNYTDYSARFSASPNGVNQPLTDYITDFGTMELDGTIYWGYKYFISSKFTQISGPLIANLVLESGNETLITQGVVLQVNPSSLSSNWNQNINQSQWYALIKYCAQMRNPDLGVINRSYLDSYYGAERVGSYSWFDHNGKAHVVFIGYDSVTEQTSQVDFSYTSTTMVMTARRHLNGSWAPWAEISAGGSAQSTSFDDSDTGIDANNVQEALEALDRLISNPFSICKSLVQPIRQLTPLENWTATKVGSSYYVLAYDGDEPSEAKREEYLLYMTGTPKLRSDDDFQHLTMDEAGTVYDFRLIGNEFRAYVVASIATETSVDELRQSLQELTSNVYTKAEADNIFATKTYVDGTFATKAQTWSAYPSIN